MMPLVLWCNDDVVTICLLLFLGIPQAFTQHIYPYAGIILTYQYISPMTKKDRLFHMNENETESPDFFTVFMRD
jgi:hypothetical protein